MAAGIVFMWIWDQHIKNKTLFCVIGYPIFQLHKKKKLSSHHCTIIRMRFFKILFLKCMKKKSIPDLSHGVGENLDNLLMRCSHYALTVDFNDAVTNSDPSSLCDPSSHQTADLQMCRKVRGNKKDNFTTT